MTNTLDVLAAVVARIKCKPGWSFRLGTDGETDGPVLIITVDGINSYHPHQPFKVEHYHPVPLTTFNDRAWRRWVFEKCQAVELHELGEWFRDGDERPYAPLHGPGENPYTLHEFRPEVDRATTQSGFVWPMDERPREGGDDG